MKAVVAAMFAGAIGCAFLQPVTAADAATYKETVLHSFCSQPNCADGGPPSGLLEVRGTLYGTTAEGGIATCDPFGCGTAYSLDPSTGVQKVLYFFCSQPNCADGASPSSLIELKGVLYGTTGAGGTGLGDQQFGTVFSLDPKTGTEEVHYSFCSRHECVDGASPNNVIAVNGILYGTTRGGGTSFYNYSEGTAFSFALRTGKEKVLYSFCQLEDCSDGQNPEAAPLSVKGALYGTTTFGGPGGGLSGGGSGVAFSLDRNARTEKVLYTFCSLKDCQDGSQPRGNLVYANGLLYGVTSAGGVAGCGNSRCGTVFSIDPNTGAEKVLYAFCSQQNCADGAFPFGGLIDVKGTLYGATQYGGVAGCGNNGCGTVYSIDPSTGTETVLYSFTGGADGAIPVSSLIEVNGTLYGTTNSGGAYGHGTVFALKKMH